MAKKRNGLVIAGRVLTVLVCLPFFMSAFFKFQGGQQVTEGMAHLGIPENVLFPLGIVETLCVVIYLIPQFAVLGSILLTGYIGGTILAHWRVGDPFYTNIVIGVVIWLAVFMREPRLRALIPFRKI